MKIKLHMVCTECADTYTHITEVEDPGVGMLDIRLLDIDVSSSMCRHCAEDCDPDFGDGRPRISWEKI